jgi:hypothetical protein
MLSIPSLLKGSQGGHWFRYRSLVGVMLLKVAQIVTNCKLAQPEQMQLLPTAN